MHGDMSGSCGFQIAKRIVDIKYISLVNLLADSEVVKELIQAEMNFENMEKAFEEILNPAYREEQLSAYHKIKATLAMETQAEK